jgi:hypothetical protein
MSGRLTLGLRQNEVVRPSDAIFRGQDDLTTWTATLIRELGHGGREAPPHVLTAIAALDEVVATCNSVIGGRDGIRDDDVTSLKEDVYESLRGLGPATSTAARAILQSFQSGDLANLNKLLLPDKHGPSVSGAKHLRSSAKELIAELLLPRTSVAAWEDVLAAFENPGSVETCSRRIAQLREIAVRRGQSWDTLERRLVGVLADRYIDVAVTRGSAVETATGDPMASAGATFDERVDLCRKVVSEAPTAQDSVVWLVFGRAYLRNLYLHRGTVQFFSGDLPIDAIRDGCPALNRPGFVRPRELEDPMAEPFFTSLPEPPFVLARVDVDARHFADVGSYARDLASGLVALAHRDARWRLFDGEAIYTAGQWWGTLGFTDPRDAEDFDDPRYERTGQFIEDLDESLDELLVDGDLQTMVALQQRRWEQAVAGVKEPAQRVSLAMRTLEEALPSTNGVVGSCERYLMDAWSMWTLGQQLRDAAHYGTGYALRPGATKDQAKLRQAILPSTGDLSFGFNPGVFLKHVSEVLEGLQGLTMQHRMVDEAALWASTGEKMTSHLGQLDERFRILLKRAIRQRNAVMHGAETVPQVVSSCEPFIRELCAQLVSQAIGAAANREDPIDRLERSRNNWLRQRTAIAENGSVPADIVFAGTLTV